MRIYMNRFSLYPDLTSDVIWTLVAFERDVGELDVGVSHTPPLRGKATFSVKSDLKKLRASMQTASSVRSENIC